MTALDSVWDMDWVRSQFPALALEAGGEAAVYLDNPAGTQVPRRVIEAVSRYLTFTNANTQADCPASHSTEEIIERARQGMAAFLGGESGDEIVFGPNMSSLTIALSRAMARLWSSGDEVVVSELDHDANVSPWIALEEQGIVIKRIPARLDDCTLDTEALNELLTPRTRLVAITHASNVFGSVTDLPRVAQLAHAVGAWLWVDAVHFGPHGSIDVRALDADFLVCSAYKFFGPHVGVLWSRAELFDRIAPSAKPHGPRVAAQRFETGAKNHEGLAGLAATIDYWSELGQRHGAEPGARGRLRAALLRAGGAIASYESELCARILDGLRGVPRLRLFGITQRQRLAERVPTFAFCIDGMPSAIVARQLADRGIFVRSGQMFMPTFLQRLGVHEPSGVVRIGAVHYNTSTDVERLMEALDELE